MKLFLATQGRAERCRWLIQQRAEFTLATTNQWVVGSNPAGRASSLPRITTLPRGFELEWRAMEFILNTPDARESTRALRRVVQFIETRG
jgi:hypothetical protein